MGFFRRKVKETGCELVIQQQSNEVANTEDIRREQEIEQMYLNNENMRLQNQDKTLDIINSGIGLVNDVAGVYAHCVELRENTKQIEAMTKRDMANIVAKYNNTERFLTESFAERKEALQEMYKKLNSNNENEVIEAMRAIAGIVTTSPLQDLEKFAQVYEDTSQKLLDF